jgi:hypothetical protein
MLWASMRGAPKAEPFQSMRKRSAGAPWPGEPVGMGTICRGRENTTALPLGDQSGIEPAVPAARPMVGIAVVASSSVMRMPSLARKRVLSGEKVPKLLPNSLPMRLPGSAR